MLGAIDASVSLSHVLTFRDVRALLGNRRNGQLPQWARLSSSRERRASARFFTTAFIEAFVSFLTLSSAGNCCRRLLSLDPQTAEIIVGQQVLHRASSSSSGSPGQKSMVVGDDLIEHPTRSASNPTPAAVPATFLVHRTLAFPVVYRYSFGSNASIPLV